MKLNKFLFFSVLISGFLMSCGIQQTSSINKIIDVIYVDTDPDKMIYLVGETFDPTGMVVNAYYQDESEGMITGWTYDNHDPLDNGEAKSSIVTIVISYEGYTTDLDITVVDSMENIGSITGLVPVSLPLYQKVNTKFDSTGCTFKVLFDGQESERIYKYGEYINGNSYNQIKVTNNNNLTANQKSVGINYSQGKEFALPITIVDKVDIEISKTEYTAKVDSFDYSSLKVVPSIVNGGEPIDVDFSKLSFVDNIEGPIQNGSTFEINGEHIITAQYSNAITLEFTINVINGSAEREPDQEANVDKHIVEFEDATQVELIDNTSWDELGSVSSYKGAHSALVKDLVSYEGEYAPSGKDFVRCVQPEDQMKVKVSSFGGKANLILRGATNRVDTSKYIATATKLSEVVDITINGMPVEIDSALEFRGKTGKDEAVDKGTIDGVNYSGRYLYCLWTDLNLGQVTLKNGYNEILITIKSGVSNPGHYDSLSLDYKPYKKEFVTDGDPIKVEAEDLSLISSDIEGNHIKVANDRTDLWPDAHSSNNKYVQDINEEDAMIYTFTASQDGYAQYSIAGASNYCPVKNTSTPTCSYDMFLVNVMQLKINDVSVMINGSLKFAGVQSSKEDGSGDRKVLTSYQEVTVVRFKVEKGKEYSITSTFTLSGDGKNYRHSYGGMAYGNYDYVLLQYAHYDE